MSARGKPAMLGRVKQDNTLLTCDQGNFSQITARSRNRTLVTKAKDTCTTTVLAAPLVPRGICFRKVPVLKMHHT